MIAFGSMGEYLECNNSQKVAGGEEGALGTRDAGRLLKEVRKVSDVETKTVSVRALLVRRNTFKIQNSSTKTSTEAIFLVRK